MGSANRKYGNIRCLFIVAATCCRQPSLNSSTKSVFSHSESANKHEPHEWQLHDTLNMWFFNLIVWTSLKEASGKLAQSVFHPGARWCRTPRLKVTCTLRMCFAETWFCVETFYVIMLLQFCAQQILEEDLEITLNDEYMEKNRLLETFDWCGDSGCSRGLMLSLLFVSRGAPRNDVFA